MTNNTDSLEFNDLPPQFLKNFLQKRYDAVKNLRDKFISIGSKPNRSAPVYFTLGANESMKTWKKKPAVLIIPVSEFDLDAVSFTYGDSFAGLIQN